MAFVNLNHYFAERLCQKDQVLRFQQILEQNKQLLIKNSQHSSDSPVWTQEDALRLLGVTPKKFMSPGYLSHFEMAAYLAHSELPDLPVLMGKNKKRKVQRTKQKQENKQKYAKKEDEGDSKMGVDDEEVDAEVEVQEVPVIDQDLLCPTTSLLVQTQKERQQQESNESKEYSESSQHASVLLQATLNTHSLGCELEEKGTRFLLGLDRESTVTRPLPNREEEIIPIYELRATPVAPDLHSMSDVLIQALTFTRDSLTKD